MSPECVVGVLTGFLSVLSECRYVALDLAGHGLSSHLPPGVFYSSLEYVADVLRVVDGV